MSRWQANGGSVFNDTRELACCLRPGEECCGEPTVIGDYDEIAQCSEEHAPLIAAAPDMRDALVELLATIDDWAGEEAANKIAGINAARAALAKAEGSQ